MATRRVVSGDGTMQSSKRLRPLAQQPPQTTALQHDSQPQTRVVLLRTLPGNSQPMAGVSTGQRPVAQMAGQMVQPGNTTAPRPPIVRTITIVKPPATSVSTPIDSSHHQTQVISSAPHASSSSSHLINLHQPIKKDTFADGSMQSTTAHQEMISHPRSQIIQVDPDGVGSMLDDQSIIEPMAPLGDDMLNSDEMVNAKEVIINGRTYRIEAIAGQQMLVDIVTNQKMLPIEQNGEIALLEVTEEVADSMETSLMDDGAGMCRIEPEEFIDMPEGSTSAANTSVNNVSTIVTPTSAVTTQSTAAGGSEFVVTTPKANTEPPANAANRSSKDFITCHFCSATFTKRSNYYRHLRRAHDTDTNKFRAKPQGKKGKCPECDSRFFTRYDLLLHLAHVHQHEVVLFNLTFNTKDAYLKWIDDVKVQYTTSYVAHNGGRKSQDGRIGRIYHCNSEFMSSKLKNSGVSKDVSMRTRRAVLNKVEYCTAHLRVFTDEKGVIYVSGSPTHINHEIDPDNLSGARVNLPSSETLPGYRSVFRGQPDALPSQTKATIASLSNKAEELRLYMQHRPVSDSVLVAMHKCMNAMQKIVSQYKCRVIISSSILEEQNPSNAVKWTVKQSENKPNTASIIIAE